MHILVGAAVMGLLYLVVFQFGTIALVLRRLAAPRDHGGPPPPDGVSILRPVCGLEHAIEATLASSFHIDHPRYELIFCVTDDHDPAIAVVRRLIDDHPQVPAKLLIGGQVGANPKLDNLMKGWDAAAYDWVVLSDSNVLIPPDYLDRLFVRWNERTEFVTSPVVGVDTQSAEELGRGLVQGKTILLQRSDLESEGGLAALGNQLAEDCAASKLARRRGREVHLARKPFAQPLGRRSFAEVWRRQLRWARVRSLAFPLTYMLELSFGACRPLRLPAGSRSQVCCPGPWCSP